MFILTEPLPNPDGWEWCFYVGNPDSYLKEAGQFTQRAIDWFNSHLWFVHNLYFFHPPHSLYPSSQADVH